MRRCLIWEDHACSTPLPDTDPVRIGAHVLVGPHASLSGATIEDECFLATGVTVFNGARLRAGCEVRINGVVHLRTVLRPGTAVPIGWVTVGDPALIAPSSRHEEIWRVQKPLDFPGYMFGLPRKGGRDAEDQMPEFTRRFGRLLGRHAEDRVVDRDTRSWAVPACHRRPSST